MVKQGWWDRRVVMLSKCWLGVGILNWETSLYWTQFQFAAQNFQVGYIPFCRVVHALHDGNYRRRNQASQVGRVFAVHFPFAVD